MSDKTCSKCQHYRTAGGGTGPSGSCWFNPPTPILLGLKDGQPMITAVRTPIAGNFPACGQFSQKLIIHRPTVNGGIADG